MFKILHKVIVAPIKIITIPTIPMVWFTILLMIFFISGGDEEEFKNDFKNLNQATKQYFVSCTKGVIS